MGGSDGFVLPVQDLAVDKMKAIFWEAVQADIPRNKVGF
jgi:hypothetical protein